MHRTTSSNQVASQRFWKPSKGSEQTSMLEERTMKGEYQPKTLLFYIFENVKQILIISKSLTHNSWHYLGIIHKWRHANMGRVWSFCDTSTWGLGHRSVTEGGGVDKKISKWMPPLYNLLSIKISLQYSRRLS